MTRFARIHEIQARASDVITRLTGAEAGFLTATASAGMTLTVTGCITGLNPARDEALPDAPGARNAVAVQMVHLCEYGAPVSQAVALAGGQTRIVAQSTSVKDYQLEAALDETCAAALYVVSHHVVDYGMIPLPIFVQFAHAKGVPVIVDASASVVA